MCSCYTVSVKTDDLIARFGIPEVDFQTPQKDLRPTNQAPVIWEGTLSSLKWGIPAPWDGKPLINARAETLAQKQTFRPLLERRCLVPANGYYEWRKDGSSKLKNYIGCKDHPVFAFAGLTDGTHFTIVTSAPIPSIQHIHSRMPVILSVEGARAWLDPKTPFASVSSYLEPDELLNLTANENVPPPPRQGELF
ncbi:MAG: SOS response-associated peptidase [Rhodospirillales bacterium]|nr:SOS response-associated peptidase [Rhodospirillales bacterium]